MTKQNNALPVVHPLQPVFDERSRVLILGTIPSPKSREAGFYYAHPQNRFWPVLASVFEELLPQTVEERKDFVLRHGIALWDVLHSCVILGAGDASIRRPEANNLLPLLTQAPIQEIFTTGRKATYLYNKYCFPSTRKRSVYLPSTSAANRGAFSLEQLCAIYRAALLPCFSN